MLSFLLVGHTANELDSIVFSPFHRHGSVESMLTLFDLAAKTNSLPKPKSVVVIESIYNFRNFFVDHLPGVSNHSKARNFELKLLNGKPVLRAKTFVSSQLGDVWGDWVECLSGSPDIATLERFPNNKEPVFKQVRHGLGVCLQKASLDAEEEEFVKHILADSSTLGATSAQHPFPILKWDKNEAHASGDIGVSGQLSKGDLRLPVRVIDAENNPVNPVLTDEVLKLRESMTRRRERMDELASESRMPEAALST